MNISLSPQTQRLLDQQMRMGRFTDPDEVVRLALQTLSQVEGEDYDKLDPQVIAAIEEAEAQYQRGEGVPWEQARRRLQSRFVKE